MIKYTLRRIGMALLTLLIITFCCLCWCVSCPEILFRPSGYEC